MISQVKITDTKLLSNEKYPFKKVSFEYQTEEGETEEQQKEVLQRSDAATILLYNKEEQEVLLTRQFRLPTFLNGNKGGLLLEACAGMMDEGESAEECIRREVEEETGYRIKEVQKVYEAYTSPAIVTELIHFFIAPYTADMKLSKGGGLKEEKEYIEVVELPLQQVVNMLKQGEIRDVKSIILLQYTLLNKILG